MSEPVAAVYVRTRSVRERHDCPDCVFLGGYGAIDVYECFRPRPEDPLQATGSRSFTIRSGPLPEGGFAVLQPEGRLWQNPPRGTHPEAVAAAIVAVLNEKKATE